MKYHFLNVSVIVSVLFSPRKEITQVFLPGSAFNLCIGALVISSDVFAQKLIPSQFQNCHYFVVQLEMYLERCENGR